MPRDSPPVLRPAWSPGSLAHILGPALIIMNTADRGDELLLGLQLEEEQELEQILEKAAKELPDVTIRSIPTPATDPLAWVPKLPQIPRVGGSGLYQLAVSRPWDKGDDSRRKPGAEACWKPSLQEQELEAKGRSTLEALTSGLDPIARLVHGEGESLVEVEHMLQALVYTAHISSTFPTKLFYLYM